VRETAKTEHIAILSIRKIRVDLRRRTSVEKRLGFAPQAHDVREKFDLRRRKFAVCPVDLAKDAAGVDEQHFVTVWPFALACRKTKACRQRDCVEEVRSDRNDDIYCAALN